MKKTFQLLWCLIQWLAYRPDIKAYPQEDPDRFDIEYGLLPRWYLPFYWLWVLFQLPFYLVIGGLSGVVKWAQQIVVEFRSDRWHTRAATWVKGTPQWKRKRGMLLLVYG